MTELDKLIQEMNSEEYTYDTTNADERIDFLENCVKLTKSPFYGKPMILMLWQKAFISTVYSFKMKDGTDRFQKILLLIARKNTKSETCSALALTEMIIGNAGADIVCSSNDDNQANILYEAIDVMRLMVDPEQLDTWKNQKHIRNKETNSKIFKLSDRTKNKEGRNIDYGVVDEVHEMQTNVIVKSIEQSQSLKPNPKMLLITTEGFTNEGFLDEELIKARKILNGEDDGIAAKRYLPWLYTQDSEAEVWQDETSWCKSNPSLGIVKKWDYLRIQIDGAKTSKADRVFVLSKDFNFKMSNASSWLMTEDYDYECSFDLEDFRGAPALGAVDLAQTTDLVCAKVLLMKKEDKTKYIHTMYFIPEGKMQGADDKDSGAKYDEWARNGHLTIVEGNEVDVTLVADWFYSLYKEYGIRLYMCGYDVKFSKEFVKQMDHYNFDYEVIQQNSMTLGQAINLVEADLRSRLINYNSNPIDKWCLGNSSLLLNTLGQPLIVKIGGKKGRRIDGAVTKAILYETYRRHKSDFHAYI